MNDARDPLRNSNPYEATLSEDEPDFPPGDDGCTRDLTEDLIPTLCLKSLVFNMKVKQ